MLTLSTEDEIGNLDVDIKSNITKIRMINNTIVSVYEQLQGTQLELAELLKAIDAKESCRIVGFFNMKRSPGNFHFSHRSR